MSFTDAVAALQDVVFVAATVAFFALTARYVRACERILDRDDR